MNIDNISVIINATVECCVCKKKERVNIDCYADIEESIEDIIMDYIEDMDPDLSWNRNELNKLVCPDCMSKHYAESSYDDEYDDTTNP